MIPRNNNNNRTNRPPQINPQNQNAMQRRSVPIADQSLLDAAGMDRNSAYRAGYRPPSPGTYRQNPTQPGPNRPPNPYGQTGGSNVSGNRASSYGQQNPYRPQANPYRQSPAPLQNHPNPFGHTSSPAYGGPMSQYGQPHPQYGQPQSHQGHQPSASYSYQPHPQQGQQNIGHGRSFSQPVGYRAPGQNPNATAGGSNQPRQGEIQGLTSFDHEKGQQAYFRDLINNPAKHGFTHADLHETFKRNFEAAEKALAKFDKKNLGKMKQESSPLHQGPKDTLTQRYALAEDVVHWLEPFKEIDRIYTPPKESGAKKALKSALDFLTWNV
jgi:hypothetical protein